MGDVGSEDVSVEMLACPINPSDVNTIQGVQHFFHFSVFLVNVISACRGVPIETFVAGCGRGGGCGGGEGDW